MSSLLTENHKQIIRNLAYSKDSISLFEAQSLSGDSMTLRYRRDWIDRYDNTARYMTGMIFSINVFPQPTNNPDPIKLEKFDKMVAEARELFNQIRKK